MRYAIVGCGRMGSAIEREAERRGHRKVAAIDTDGARGSLPGTLDRTSLGEPDVAFEFTVPEAAESNVITLLRAGVPVVCGTTGWSVGPTVRQALEQAGVGAVIAPNFSLGMDLFLRLVAEAGRSLGRAGFHDPYVFEMHHRGKRDAPSGTARKLAQVLREVDPRLTAIVEGNPEGALPDGALHVASLRAGAEPGTHCVGFDGEHDRITLTHRASGRSGFALGAVLAGEWIRARRGLHDFRAVVDALLERGQPI